MVDNGDSGCTRGLLWGHHHMMGADRRSSRRVMVLEQIELAPRRFGRVGDWDEIWPLVSAGLKKEEDDAVAASQRGGMSGSLDELENTRAESDEDGALSRRPVATMVRETWHRDSQASPLIRCQLCGDNMIDYESHTCY